MDEADEGNELAEHYKRLALEKRKPVGPQAVGHCLNCGEQLGGKRRWCDADCRDDWAKLTAKERDQAAVLLAAEQASMDVEGLMGEGCEADED